MMQQMTLVVPWYSVQAYITTCLSVAKCQYCPRYRKITPTVANLFTYLLHRITKTTELTKKVFLNSIFNEMLLRTVCQVLCQTHNQWIKQINTRITSTRTWANAERDGRPAEYRWRPLFNAIKFGRRALLECRAVTLPRRETRWNLQGCPKLANRSQLLVGRSSPYYQDMWRRYCCLAPTESDSEQAAVI